MFVTPHLLVEKPRVPQREGFRCSYFEKKCSFLGGVKNHKFLYLQCSSTTLLILSSIKMCHYLTGCHVSMKKEPRKWRVSNSFGLTSSPFYPISSAECRCRELLLWLLRRKTWRELVLVFYDTTVRRRKKEHGKEQYKQQSFPTPRLLLPRTMSFLCGPHKICEQPRKKPSSSSSFCSSSSSSLFLWSCYYYFYSAFL